MNKFLNWKLFITSKFLTKERNSKSWSVFILSTFAVALSIAVMIISISTLKGFKNQIKSKIYQVQGDFIIDSGKNTESGEPEPIENTIAEDLLKLDSCPWINSISPSIMKSCILKSDEEIEGIIAKSTEENLVNGPLKGYIQHGNKKLTQNGCAISKLIATKLQVETGETLIAVFFLEDYTGRAKPRARKLKIEGIYETGIDQIDGNLMFVNSELLLPLTVENHWYSQIEIRINTELIEKSKAKKRLLVSLPNANVQVKSIEEDNQSIFDWLAILNTNVLIILVLMSIVAIITMSTTLLILVIERTSVIGLLFTMGARFKDVQRIFHYQALIISLFGIVFGTLIAAIIIFGQNYFQWIQLPQEIYFVDQVILDWNVKDVIIVNLASVFLIFMSLYIPAKFVKKIQPIKAVRFK